MAKDHPGAVVLGCDTVVDVGGEVFGKPHSVEDAKRMLRALSGATHEVHTGVCVSDGVRTESFVDSCRVTFFPISEGEIDAYTATKEPYDKAGAYAIQGRAALWLDRLEGDYYTIMGLPVSRTARLLSDSDAGHRKAATAAKNEKTRKSLRKCLRKARLAAIIKTCYSAMSCPLV